MQKILPQKLSIIKDGELKGEKPSNGYVLLDDVTTKGNSLLEAITIIGSQPEEIIVAVDRRERNENPRVKAIFEP